MDKRFTICLAAVLLCLTAVTPFLMYSYLTGTYGPIIDSYKNREKTLQQQVDKLKLENAQLSQGYSQLTNLTQPHVITCLGWYLHKSNDQYTYSKNKFTIYGKIINIGDTPANNAELTIKFYDASNASVQTSTIYIGTVHSIINVTASPDIGTHNIDCPAADSVTDIDVSLQYQ